MPQQLYIKDMMKCALAAAIAYAIAAWFYIVAVSYSESWVLFIGNFLFAAVIAVFIAWYYKRHRAGINIIKMITVGGKTAVAGIGIACIMCFLLLWIFMPGVFRPVSASHLQLNSSPAQFSGKNQGYALILFMNAVLGNAGAAFFISLLLPFSIIRNQQSGKEP